MRKRLIMEVDVYAETEDFVNTELIREVKSMLWNIEHGDLKGSCFMTMEASPDIQADGKFKIEII